MMDSFISIGGESLPVTDPPPPKRPAGTMAVVATPGTNAYLLSIPGMVFQSFAPEGHRWRVEFCAEKPGRVQAMGGMEVQAPISLEQAAFADVIVVPYWRHPAICPPEPVLALLRGAARDGKTVVGFCLGAYALAYAGLLDGRRAVTHWRFAADFQRRFPQIQVNSRNLYEDDGGRVTSAGISAGMDCCLYLLRKFEGAAAANAAARDMVAPLCREGGQAQYIEEAVPRNTRDARINRVIAHLEENIGQRFSVSDMARLAIMSERTFARAFGRATGMSPGSWLLQLRIRRAEELLESTDMPVAQVSDACGFASPVTFRQAFVQKKGIPPLQWRRAFRGK